MIGPVHIAGGGVSGLATAVLLARQGAQVEVHDRHVGGGGRFHGGWQVLDNGLSPVDALEELHGLGLTGRPPVVPAHRAVLLDAFGGRHEVSSRAPFTYFLRRGGEGSLDAWLREQAIELGVTLREGCEAPGDAQVVATGPHRADGVAREVVFASDLPDTVMVLFDPNVTPSGYAYLFCLQGHATFGVAQVRCLRLLPAARQVAWVRFRRELGDFAVRDPRESGQFMSFAPPPTLRDRDGRWHAGEAAGVQHYLFGLGIRFALRSASLVADGVLGRWDQARYERELRIPMLVSVAMRWGYERLGPRAFRVGCRLASKRDFQELLVRAQRPGLLRRALARVVMAAWDEGPRNQGPLGGWRRRREVV
ncbi:MAG TPA: NAD(P)-binding protein [Thermoanaerobaculaceae bacterium]|nr:NAD(P)-binding protein [Thermoanaerobaculaceae bacterium]